MSALTPTTGAAPATTEVSSSLLEQILEEMETTRRLKATEESVFEKLSLTPDGADVFQRKLALSEACYRAAIRRTRPQDWVLTQDMQGHAFAMLKASGASIVAELYGVVISNIRPVDDTGIFRPEVEKFPNGAYALKAWCDCESRVNGRKIEHLSAARRSDEDFVGRLVNGETGALVKKRSAEEEYTANPTDLASAVHTLLLTKAVRSLCGMTRVPVSDLAAAWEKTGKKTEDCVAGHGFGTADGRRAQGVATGDVKEGLDKLKAEVLRLAGGSKIDFAKIAKDITSNKEKGFAGFDNLDRLAQDWQVANAWANLKKHPLYSPPKDAPAAAAANGATAAAKKTREPGDDQE